MYLTDEQIVGVLIDYITDSRYEQAILIDGEWGSGKTYFIKEKLLEELKKGDLERSVFYISLYGLDDFDQIMNQIYTSAFEDYLEEKIGTGKGEKLGKGLKFTSKILLAGLKKFDIDPNDLPSLSDIKQIKDVVIIFDDIERCNIDINQLFGFINNLVEHNNIKAILVANQAEIGRVKISKDLPQKYSLALDSRIYLDEVKEGNQDNKGNEGQLINKEQLIYRTNKLFSEDILYKKVKEKLISHTIYYQGDLNAIYESIVERHVKNKDAEKQLKNSKKVILDIFEKKQHNNIRTLLFGMMAYERIFEIIDTISFDPLEYLQEHKDKILKYTMELSVQIKSGKSAYSWNNTTAETGLVHWEELAFGRGVFGYKFVDSYLLHRYLDSGEIKRIITLLMSKKKEEDNQRKAENALVYKELYYWWKLEDEEIEALLLNMKEELAEQKYHPRYFKDMIIMLMRMEYNMVNGILYNDYIPLMKSKLENIDIIFERQYLEILSDDPDFVGKYNTLVQPLFDVVDRKEKESKKVLNYYLDDIELWDDNFVSQCQKNRENYMQDHKFLFYMVPDKFIEKLKIAGVREIHCFLDGINVVYNFSNLNDFFKADVPNIKRLLEKIDVEKLSEGKRTREMALKQLHAKLSKSLQCIER